jgi:hypothetical protein
MLTGTGKSKKMASRRANQRKCQNLQDSLISSSGSVPGPVGGDGEVRAGSRMEFSLSVVLVTAVVFGRCCVTSMLMTFKVQEACSSCSAF